MRLQCWTALSGFTARIRPDSTLALSTVTAASAPVDRASCHPMHEPHKPAPIPCNNNELADSATHQPPTHATHPPRRAAALLIKRQAIDPLPCRLALLCTPPCPFVTRCHLQTDEEHLLRSVVRLLPSHLSMGFPCPLFCAMFDFLLQELDVSRGAGGEAFAAGRQRPLQLYRRVQWRVCTCRAPAAQHLPCGCSSAFNRGAHLPLL